jgi:hypothetical protein
VLFAVSTAFPVAAAFIPQERPPVWIGFIDVALAALLVFLALLTDSVARAKIDARIVERSYRLYRTLAVVPLVLLVLFFLAGDSIKWEVLLPGLAWRAWLLLYFLPSWLAAWETRASIKGPGEAQNT